MAQVQRNLSFLLIRTHAHTAATGWEAPSEEGRRSKCLVCSSISTSVFETESLTEAGSHWFSYSVDSATMYIRYIQYITRKSQEPPLPTGGGGKGSGKSKLHNKQSSNSWSSLCNEYLKRWHMDYFSAAWIKVPGNSKLGRKCFSRLTQATVSHREDMTAATEGCLVPQNLHMESRKWTGSRGGLSSLRAHLLWPTSCTEVPPPTGSLSKQCHQLGTNWGTFHLQTHGRWSIELSIDSKGHLKKKSMSLRNLTIEPPPPSVCVLKISNLP